MLTYHLIDWAQLSVLIIFVYKQERNKQLTSISLKIGGGGKEASRPPPPPGGVGGGRGFMTPPKTSKNYQGVGS